MAYRAAICDDRNTDAAFVRDILYRWAADRQLDVHVELYPSAEAFLFRYAEEKRYDLLLLDVEMGPMDGVSLAKRVRATNPTVQIIFITGYSDYIAEGYEVAALHYLVKPVNPDKLFQVLDRAKENLRRNDRFLNLEISGEMVRLPCHEIRYLDVQQNYVTIHAGQTYTVKRSLREFEQDLDDRFFRAGRGLILNLGCIRRTTRTQVFLEDGTVLPLPRGVYDPLNRAIIDRA